MDFEKLSRREFLCGATGVLAFLSGCRTLNIYIKYDDEERNVKKIYNELPNYVHRINAEVEINNKNFIAKRPTSGCGVILGDKYLTVAHLFNPDILFYGNPAIDLIKIQDKDFFKKSEIKRKVKLYGKELEELVCNYQNDVAIYKLPEGLLKDKKKLEFPCKTSTKVNLGDEVYLIGNPGLNGTITRPCVVSDLDGVKDNNSEIQYILDEPFGKISSFFGLDKPSIPGDSGSPVVNKNFKLLGFVSFSYVNAFGYVKRIEEFLKEDCMKK